MLSKKSSQYVTANETTILDLCTTGADPGFPIKGGADTPGVALTYNFAQYSRKLHETEKNFGGARWGRSADIPMASMMC